MEDQETASSGELVKKETKKDVEVLTNNSLENVSKPISPKLENKEIILKSVNEDASTKNNENEDKSSAENTKTEEVKFKVIFNKKKHDITYSIDATVLELKKHLKTIIEVEPTMQKLMFKGLAKDTQSLRELGIKTNSKLMVVGSKLTDVVLATTPVTASSSKDEKLEPKESICVQKPHAKVIEKGIPDDVMPGYENGKESLPTFPLKGMTNKHGSKVRLTFKLEEDQLWLGTKERTEKITLNSIKDVISAKIDNHPGYSMIALQLGPTDQSRYWIYWVPSQYVDAIKDVVLGKWQFF